MLKFNKKQNEILLNILNQELQNIEISILYIRMYGNSCDVGMSSTEKSQRLYKKRVDSIIKKIEVNS